MNEKEKGRLIKLFIDIRRCLQSVAGQGNLTQGEFLVLRRIRIECEGAGERLSNFRAVRISQYLSMPPPALSRLFNSLEGKGLIRREINQDNRRSVIVVLTESGKKVLREAEAKVDGFMDEVFDCLGESDSQLLLKLLEKVMSVFDKKGLVEGECLD